MQKGASGTGQTDAPPLPDSPYYTSFRRSAVKPRQSSVNRNPIPGPTRSRFFEFLRHPMRSALNIVNLVLIAVLLMAAVSVQARVEASGIIPLTTLAY